MWRKLLDWKQKLPTREWIIGGDFNAIKSREERKGKTVSSGGEMEEFAKFIELMEGVDLPVIGKKFTWINSNEKARSRIDRILLSEGIINRWKVVAQVTGNRDISDHMPVCVKSSNLYWGPKPFKVFNSWDEYEDFFRFVKQQSDSVTIKGSSAFMLKEKFKRLKDSLRGWNHSVFGRLNLEIEEEVELLNELEMVDTSNSSQLSQEVNDKRKNLQENFWRKILRKESMLK
ncbi:uncharacterized protein LOC131620122 [Vicia villosa]|uniref:uncharacterized protein LOC131620122 n=1 Tax=Vicia villosa TaxID=3911 RepID=UPI00273B5FE8|nr:uncharacterized protein LOC131620122 [Vicia villosa]